MTSQQEYWSNPRTTRTTSGAWLEQRAAIALDLIRAWGTVAGTTGAEDSTGRARIDLMSESDLVHRCFNIAVLFVREAESQGWIRQDDRTAEEQAADEGVLRRIAAEKEYPWRENAKA